MTLHVQYDHECLECGAAYIPYDSEVPCPRCGAVETERFDFISEALASLRFNKASFGQYTPIAWFVGSLGDHVLGTLFHLLDEHEEQSDGTPFASFAEERLDEADWADQPYMKDHVLGIAMRVGDSLGVR